MRYYRVRRNRRLLEEQKRENYNIIKGKAITEDKILVFNLYVYHIPKSITKEQILDYFKKYGEIKNVRLIKDQKPKNVQNTSRIAFVNFLEATSATKVLANKSHFINDKRIQVRACDSWHQPGAKENAYCSATTTSTGINNTNNASCLQEEALILKLNDDCLEMIVNFLPIVDQINFGQTCRFNGVFIMHSKTKYKKLKLRILEKLTLWQTRRFLQMAGPQIHILEDTYWEPNTRVIESLGLFCKNVETIDISDIELKPALLRKLLKNMKNVNKLILNRAGLSDLCIPVFKNLPKLKHLSLDDNSKLTVSYRLLWLGVRLLLLILEYIIFPLYISIVNIRISYHYIVYSGLRNLCNIFRLLYYKYK
ncbi:uncharacterized protein LOC142238338 isoform X2 [Haematobia irritans]|uniref:uncharacterized protein LOC142238338 isoform X2 n=1 Tax=Haematobia irritans TaxID=7368 RepID=UPI003F50809F